jgi:hypothetical protein
MLKDFKNLGAALLHSNWTTAPRTARASKTNGTTESLDDIYG